MNHIVFINCLQTMISITSSFKVALSSVGEEIQIWNINIYNININNNTKSELVIFP